MSQNQIFAKTPKFPQQQHKNKLIKIFWALAWNSLPRIWSRIDLVKCIFIGQCRTWARHIIKMSTYLHIRITTYLRYWLLSSGYIGDIFLPIFYTNFLHQFFTPFLHQFFYTNFLTPLLHHNFCFFYTKIYAFFTPKILFFYAEFWNLAKSWCKKGTPNGISKSRASIWAQF